MHKLKKRFKNEKGQGMVEYGLILATVSIVAILGLSTLGGNIKGQLEGITDSMGGISEPGQDPYDEWLKDSENKGYVVAKDEDFTGDEDGKFIYNGTNEKVIVPEIIKEVPITSVKEMFSKDTPVVAVAVNNPDLIDMSYMFHNNPSRSLDVSNLVTENAWRMEGMFKGSKSESLDLSSFDTSKVKDMKYMFRDRQATIIDLSSFETSNVTIM